MKNEKGGKIPDFEGRQIPNRLFIYIKLTFDNQGLKKKKKMQIQIKCSCGEKCREWAIVEVQGAVEVQPDFQDRLHNLQIGVLCRPSSQVPFS